MVLGVTSHKKMAKAVSNCGKYDAAAAADVADARRVKESRCVTVPSCDRPVPAISRNKETKKKIFTCSLGLLWRGGDEISKVYGPPPLPP